MCLAQRHTPLRVKFESKPLKNSIQYDTTRPTCYPSCKNLIVQLSGLLCMYTEQKLIHGFFSTPLLLFFKFLLYQSSAVEHLGSC